MLHCLSLSTGFFSPPDVYSYDEDDMVLDSKLPEHLAHFGIDMMTMEKACSVGFFFFFYISVLFSPFKNDCLLFSN